MNTPFFFGRVTAAHNVLSWDGVSVLPNDHLLLCFEEPLTGSPLVPERCFSMHNVGNSVLRLPTGTTHNQALNICAIAATELHLCLAAAGNVKEAVKQAVNISSHQVLFQNLGVGLVGRKIGKLRLNPPTLSMLKPRDKDYCNAHGQFELSVSTFPHIRKENYIFLNLGPFLANHGQFTAGRDPICAEDIRDQDLNDRHALICRRSANDDSQRDVFAQSLFHWSAENFLPPMDPLP